jgi:hypothetical protein
MSCECYKIGGPWITYDPDCPAHGDEAQRAEKQREREEEEREERHQAELAERDARIAVLESKVRWNKTSDGLPEAGRLIVKRWTKKGSQWAGRYSGTPKDSSFDEWIYLPE